MKRYAVIVVAALAACSADDPKLDGEKAPESPPDAGVLESNPRADTQQGIVFGSRYDGADAFRGMPFASPPVGPLRWAPPQPPAAWNDERPATQFAAACPQELLSRPGYNPDYHEAFIGDEDCLYLNVWTPTERSDEPLAVMFFIHGGANTTGSGSEAISFMMDLTTDAPVYDGAKMASRGNVVVVTTNYRLGPLGFMAHPAMVAESESGHVGNYGILDQIAALEWVKSNIAEFGGDPDNITIFGQSAGAYNVCTLLNSPLAHQKSLFAKAIMHSGICRIHEEEMVHDDSQSLMEEVGCADAADVMACMREVSPKAIATSVAARPNAIGSFNFYPYVDGYVAVRQPIDSLSQGENLDIPFMIGVTEDEYANRNFDAPPSAYEALVHNMYGDQAENILLLYPLSDFESPQKALSAILTDKNLTCTSRMIARRASSGSPSNVYRYHFRQTMTAEERMGDGPYHSSDLLYLFQHMDSGLFEASGDDRQTQELMLSYWTNFAKTGDPNSSTLPSWPAYDVTTDPFQIINSQPESGMGLRSRKCDYWSRPTN
jgi:para-nitrobenzyl esterase